MSNWTLYEGDCLEVMRTLPAESVDAIVTDPPYCSGGFNETQRRHAKGQGLRSETLRDQGWFINDNMTTGGLVWMLRQVACESHRLLRDGGSLCVFTDWRMYPHIAPALESSGLRLQNMVVWNKGNPGLGRGFRPQHELIMHFVKNTGEFFDKSVGNVITVKRVPATRRLHQTEKPVELLTAILRVVAPIDGTVLDPFAGSGSTLVAAVQMGRKAIGIELDPHYCDIIRKRMREAVRVALPMDA